MRWQYKASLLLMVLSQTVFLGFAAYHIDTRGDVSEYLGISPAPTVGYSWIWHHPEHWIISLVLNLAGMVVFASGIIKEKGPDWKLSNFIKIEIVETEEEKF